MRRHNGTNRLLAHQTDPPLDGFRLCSVTSRGRIFRTPFA